MIICLYHSVLFYPFHLLISCVTVKSYNSITYTCDISLQGEKSHGISAYLPVLCHEMQCIGTNLIIKSNAQQAYRKLAGA